MSKRKEREDKNLYSLWTSPRACWENPIKNLELPKELSQRSLKQISEAVKGKKELLNPFSTPINPDNLKQIVD